MRGALASGGVVLGGVATSLLTVAGITLIDLITGFNLFSFSLWFIIPVGAMICGAVAASGYYIASIVLHKRPKPILLLQMVVVAALTQLLIYYAEYAMLTVDGTPASSLISFPDYMDLVLTKTHYKAGRAMQIDAGEVGSFGYWLAALDFIGFIAGAVFLYLYLTKRAFCEACGKYFSTLKAKTDLFETHEEFADYYDGEFSDPVDSQEFAERVHWERHHDAAQGSIKLSTKVLGCPSCAEQIVSETVDVFNGKEWKAVNELARSVRMPEGMDVAAVYGGEQPSFIKTLA